MQQEIDDFDFPWALDGILFVRPVLFIGDFTGGEDEKGTLFMDRIIVEVFPDLATANATPLDTTNPGGIPGAPVTVIPGDANGDGSVDLLDLDILGTNFGTSPATFAQGDFNGDNTVDLLDLDILGTNFGAGGTPVPEPTTALLALGGIATLLIRRRFHGIL